MTIMTELLSLFNIAMIDIVLAGDNALIIGMTAAKVEPNLRPRVIRWGLIGAVSIRIIITIGATYILTIIGLTLAGGLLLLFVCWKLFKEIRGRTHRTAPDTVEASGQESMTFASAIIMIAIADLSMSLDNVLAVAGAAKGHTLLLAGGLTLSIFAMAFAANYIAKLLTTHSWIMWIGLTIISYISIEMILRGASEVSCYAMFEIGCWDKLHNL